MVDPTEWLIGSVVLGDFICGERRRRRRSFSLVQLVVYFCVSLDEVILVCISAEQVTCACMYLD